MIRDAVGEKIGLALSKLMKAGELPDVEFQKIEVLDTKQREHGHFACNFAMANSKSFSMNPRALAEKLCSELQKDKDLSRIEIAGPGFLNISLKPEFFEKFLLIALSLGEALAYVKAVRSATGLPAGAPGLKINVEFVSVNPNGPITIGSGRGAAYGSSLCNVLAAAGNTVHREYYINDGVNSEQMRLFALSVQSQAQKTPFPEKGYKGDYVQEIANVLLELSESKTADTEWFHSKSQELMLKAQHSALTAFGVEFDTWFSEQSLHDNGMVEIEINQLVSKGIADNLPSRTKLKMAKGGIIEEVIHESQPVDEDDAEGQLPTLWLRSTKLGDDMDRVLRRKDGRLTYIASDVSYHKDKFNRPLNADKLITVLGPDHHGYIGRLQAVVAAMLLKETGNPDSINELDERLFSTIEEQSKCESALFNARNSLEVQIYQLVRFMKEGKPAPMRKRDGNIYALIDLLSEIGTRLVPQGSREQQLSSGKDVARFFYLMRSHDTTFDFDLDLAETQSDENPVFYVHYAHARICSILEKGGEAGLKTELNPSLLIHEKELDLIQKICDLPWEVERASIDYGVHRLATYAIELARTFHGFYDQCHVVQLEQPELSGSRLVLCKVTRDTIRAVLKLLGVSAPEKM